LKEQEKASRDYWKKQEEALDLKRRIEIEEQNL
jgi:hypothetical protein